MERILKLTEKGSDRELFIPATNIKYFESITYEKTKEIVTHITLTDDSTIDVKEPCEEVRQLYNAALK